MEKTDEWQGAGMEYTTEYRQYDPRLGRWMSLDPLMARFPHQSAYIGMDDNPVALSDPRGNCTTCPGGGGGNGNGPVPTLPTAGQLLQGAASFVGVQDNTVVDAAAGFVDSQLNVNNVLNMASNRVNTIVKNPARILTPVDLVYTFTEGFESARNLAEGIASGDAYSIGQGAGFAAQIIAGGAAAAKQGVSNAKSQSAIETPTATETMTVAETGVVEASGTNYTKSNLQRGQEMHRQYKIGEVSETGVKEYRLPSGKRIDFLDIRDGKIYELKPYNPRAMKQGMQQLEMYRQELQTLEQFKGITWELILDTY